MSEPLPLVLASTSPRRHALLRSVGLDFSVKVSNVDETPETGEQPTDYVGRVARMKCIAVVAAEHSPRAIVLAADTTVEIDGQILTKPADAHDAKRMLSSLSGRTHYVHTGVAAWTPVDQLQVLVTTAVTFGELSAEEIEWYVGLGESFDKAGAYGIQSAGAALVERVDGSHSNVVGLPLRETLQLLRDLQDETDMQHRIDSGDIDITGSVPRIEPTD